MSETERRRQLREISDRLETALREATEARNRMIAASSFKSAEDLARLGGGTVTQYAARIELLGAQVAELLHEKRMIAAG